MAASLPALTFGVLLTACDSLDTEDDQVNRQDVVATASVDETIQLSGEEVFSLKNVNGDIEIDASGQGSMIRVQAELIAGSDSRSDAEEWLDKLHVRIGRNSGKVVVETDFPKDQRGRRLEVRYHVSVPEGIGVELEDLNGQIAVADVLGPVEIHHVNGRVDIEGLHGTADVTLINGTIDCEMDLDPEGFAFLSTVNGQIEFGIPTSTSARIHAATLNGQIRFENLTIKNESGNQWDRSGMMGAGGGQIELSAVNGTITVRGM